MAVFFTLFSRAGRVSCMLTNTVSSVCSSSSANRGYVEAFNFCTSNFRCYVSSSSGNPHVTQDKISGFGVISSLVPSLNTDLDQLLSQSGRSLTAVCRCYFGGGLSNSSVCASVTAHPIIMFPT